MTETTPFRLAIIGSGPAGCYLAQSVLRARPGTEITIFDRLASPYGLVRYGVAADHQHTKAITRQFDRLLQDPNVTFAGNVEIGTDIKFDVLREHYDATVLATGLTGDRPLGIEGDRLSGVYGAGTLTRVLNTHPGEQAALPELGDHVILVGGGNVAIDLLRFLVKSHEQYDQSDIADHALEGYLSSPAKSVTLLNRSSAADAKSDPQMLKELANIARAHYSSPEFSLETGDADTMDRTAAARVAAFGELFSEGRTPAPGPDVSFRFGSTPIRVLGTDRVEGIEVLTQDGVEILPATSVITAIGFESEDNLLHPELHAHSAVGRIEPGLYRTGWAKRGPKGAIPENRTCAKLVSSEIIEDLDAGILSVGAPGFHALPKEVTERRVSFQQWSVLEAHERELATPDRIRQKLSDHDAMVRIAQSQD